APAAVPVQASRLGHRQRPPGPAAGPKRRAWRASGAHPRSRSGEVRLVSQVFVFREVDSVHPGGVRSRWAEGGRRPPFGSQSSLSSLPCLRKPEPAAQARVPSRTLPPSFHQTSRPPSDGPVCLSLRWGEGKEERARRRAGRLKYKSKIAFLADSD